MSDSIDKRKKKTNALFQTDFLSGTCICRLWLHFAPAFALRPADNGRHYHAYVVDRSAVGGHRRLPKNTRPLAFLLTVASHGTVLSEPASEQQAGHSNPPFASLRAHGGRVFTQHETRHRALADSTVLFFFPSSCLYLNEAWHNASLTTALPPRSPLTSTESWSGVVADRVWWPSPYFTVILLKAFHLFLFFDL